MHRYRHGDHLVTSDLTGRVFHASDSRIEWNGLLVHKDEFETRHPQDLVRAKPERMSVENPRPEPTPIFIGPLTTKIVVGSAAGATSITVESTVRMQAADRLYIMLDNGDTFRTTIQSVSTVQIMTLASPLPWSISPGNAVTNNTAMAESDVGNI